LSLPKVFENWAELRKQLDEKRAQGLKVVFTNGCFDILHVGHVRYLEEARSCGDILVVGLNRDASVRQIKGPKRPVNDEMSRAEVIAALSSVSYVSLFGEDTAEAIVKALRPDVYVKGGDWKVEDTPEGKAVLSYGGQVAAMHFINGFSTTSIIEKAKI
jgi:D-beta-D-heptose 7-phosphate kinase/D-beta-D-heptose 1-phosphate adenosyltransferase